MALTARQSYMMGTTPPAVSGSMPATVGKRVWTSQPQVPVGIDWRNPITRGLAIAYSLTRGVNLVNNKSIARSGSVPSVPTSVGIASSFSNSVANYLGEVSNGCPVQTTASSYGLTQIVLAIPSNVSSQQALMSFNGTGNQRTRIELSAGGFPGFVTRQVNLGTAVSVTSYVSISVGVPVVIAGVTRAQNDHAVFVNGAETGTSSTSLTAGASTFDRHYIGLDGVSTGLLLPASAGIVLSLAWNRALSSSEIRSISANPWQIFTPLPKQVWVPA